MVYISLFFLLFSAADDNMKCTNQCKRHQVVGFLDGFFFFFFCQLLLQLVLAACYLYCGSY